MNCQFGVAIALVVISLLSTSCGFAQSIDEIEEPAVVEIERAVPLPGTEKLTMTGDIASELVAGVDRFLLQKLAESPKGREKYWRRDFSSEAAYSQSVAANRSRLAKMIGLVEERTKSPRVEAVTPPNGPVPFAGNDSVRATAVRWHAFGLVHGEGILLTPMPSEPHGRVIVIGDCDEPLAKLAGIEDAHGEAAVALQLAHSGLETTIVHLIGREPAARNGRAVMSDREFVYRSSFELGRHPLGYDVAKVLALVDAWKKESPETRIGVVGRGEGGFIALLAAALDERIDGALVQGFFGPREGAWNEPLDRNVFGFLREFGCAETATLIAPRMLVVDPTPPPASPYRQFAAGQGGAPYELKAPTEEEVWGEVERALKLTKPLNEKRKWLFFDPSKNARETFATRLVGVEVPLRSPGALRLHREGPRQEEIKTRQMEELIVHNSQLLVESPYTRNAYFSDLKTDSVENFQATVEPYRKRFEEEVIGKFDDPLMPPQPRTRLAYETEKWKGYEVVLDVFPDVIAYGILLVPKDLRDGEKRPVIVCQHGLEGRPQDVIGRRGFGAYKAFAARLAERGFVTFAPQNLYIFEDRFRTLQRKANPLGTSLFSIMVPQHRQIVKWLGELDFIDKERIAFYGLSYGGKSAMRIPPLVPEYCLSICSADFNEWVWKNASTRSPYSYVWTGEYEIFEWNLGGTFNYAEMATLIAPRPFMVERGSFDNVAPDETVAYEFAKVKRLYHAQLRLPEEHCQIEFFVGPHTINGKGTFEFLHRHLRWPAPEEQAQKK